MTVMVTSPVEGVIDVCEAEVPRGGLLMTANFWAVEAIVVETAGLTDSFNAGDDRCERLFGLGFLRFAGLARSQSSMYSGSKIHSLSIILDQISDVCLRFRPVATPSYKVSWVSSLGLSFVEQTIFPLRLD